MNTPQITASATAASQRSKRKKRIILIIAIALPLVFLMIVMFRYTTWESRDWATFKPALTPSDPIVKRWQKTTIENAQKSHDEFDAALAGTDKYPGRSTHESCEIGHNNLKSTSGYAHQCTYRVTSFYGFNGDFSEQVTDLETKLLSAGWRNSGYDRSEEAHPMKAIVNAYNTNYGKAIANFPDGYFLSDFPKVSYQKEGQGLLILFAEQIGRPSDDYDIRDIEENSGTSNYLNTYYNKKDFQNARKVFKELSKTNRFVLVLASEEKYFTN